MTADTQHVHSVLLVIGHQGSEVRRLFFCFVIERSVGSVPIRPRQVLPEQEGVGEGLSRDRLPWSESLLIGCQVLLGSLVGLQSFDGVDVLRQLRLPPHQNLLLLQLLQTLRGRSYR